MTDALATRPTNGHADIVERVLVAGDLARLTPAERVRYYGELCRSLSLNPLSKPFEYIVLNGKLQLYALKTATDQLRALHGVSITRLETRVGEDGVYEVTATARTRDGRIDTDMGAVSVQGLRGEALCNARLKAITKSKRRVTLSICGLGWLDESEVASIPDAQPVAVDMQTGEIAAEPLAVVHPAQRERSRVPAEGKRWSEAQLAWFWASLGDLEPPRFTSDEVHRILGVDSIHAWPGDLDAALALVREAHGANLAEGDPADERERILATLDAPFAGEHPTGSVEHEWARYTALDARAQAWNRAFPEQPIRYADPPRDAPALQVRAYADGLERRLAKLAAP